MVPEQWLVEITSLLTVVFDVLQAGLTITALGYVAHHAIDWLSVRMQFDPPDPTVWKRSWRRLFDQYFDPVGQHALDAHRRPVWNQIRYQLTVGVVAVAAVMGVYMIGSVTTILGMVVLERSVGTVPPVSSTIEQLAAVCVVLGMAVIFTATERSRTIPS